jgi:GntR family transcriptional regulator, transcriptional repressor for pyruvate dehydrogenase complex
VARTDDVVQSIREMILSGEIRSGDKLPVENDLALRMGVSRGSLREGVRALTAMGILDTRQGDGTYVTSLEPELLLGPLAFIVDLHGADRARHFLSVRRVLECEAAAEAARLAEPEAIARAEALLDEATLLLEQDPADRARLLDLDQAFHRTLLEAGGNPVLVALAAAISGRTARARMLRSVTEERAQLLTVQEHRGILRAVAAHDPERARLRMASHLLAVEEFLENVDPELT